MKILSDDGATTMSFNSGGTYSFFFSNYNIKGTGSYTYENGVLTITNKKEVEAKVKGDPMKLHYVTAKNDQLTGDYTIPAESLQEISEN